MTWGYPYSRKPPYMGVYMYIYPPTPALAKAGAAPGTTGGVEPGLSRPWPSPCPSLFQQARPRRPIQGNSSARHQRPNTMLPQAFPKPISPPASPSKATLPLNTSGQTPGPCAFKGVQACRLPGLKPFKCFKSFRRPFQSQSRPPQAVQGKSSAKQQRPNTRAMCF